MNKGADVNAGADVNDGLPSGPLFYASQGGHFEVAAYLLERRASLNEKTIFQAVIHGHRNVLQLLFAHGAGAYVNNKDHEGFTLLHRAIGHHGSIGLVKYLVNNGADIYARATQNNLTSEEFAIAIRRPNRSHFPGYLELTDIKRYLQQVAEAHRCHAIVLSHLHKKFWEGFVSADTGLNGRRARDVDERNIEAITKNIDTAWKNRNHNHVQRYLDQGLQIDRWSWSDAFKTYVTIHVEVWGRTRAQDILARTTDSRNVEIVIDMPKPERYGGLLNVLDEDRGDYYKLVIQEEGEGNDQVRLTVALPFDCKGDFINPFGVALTAGVDVGVFPMWTHSPNLLHVSLEKKLDEEE